jgi:hypothetical protein
VYGDGAGFFKQKAILKRQYEHRRLSPASQQFRLMTGALGTERHFSTQVFGFNKCRSRQVSACGKGAVGGGSIDLRDGAETWNFSNESFAPGGEAV